MVVYDHRLVMVGVPLLPVIFNTMEEEQGASGSQQSAGITSISEPEFSVIKQHVVVPSIEVFCTMCGVHVYYCMV